MAPYSIIFFLLEKKTENRLIIVFVCVYYKLLRPHHSQVKSVSYTKCQRNTGHLSSSIFIRKNLLEYKSNWIDFQE